MIRLIVGFFSLIGVTRRLPWDQFYRKRNKGAWFMGLHRLVEPSAGDVVFLQDELEDIRTNSLYDDAERSRRMFGLRCSALARSVRTLFGRIPYDANDPKDLELLSKVPAEYLIPAFNEAARLSGLYWVAVNLDTDKEPDDEESSELESPYTKEEIAENPS